MARRDHIADAGAVAVNRTTLPLRRRTRAERRGLAILRDSQPVLSDPDAARCFRLLRRLATRRGMTVHLPETPYVSESELAILSWIANGQRSGEPLLPVDDRKLAIVTSRCATLLNHMQLRLSPLTLHSGRASVA
jgi:hypothetical protein